MLSSITNRLMSRSHRNYRKQSTTPDDFERFVMDSEAESCHSAQKDNLHWTQQQEKKVVQKLDSRLIPLLAICYMLQFFAKNSLGSASILGGLLPSESEPEAGYILTSTQYSWSSSIFYFGYLLFSYPTSILLVKVPIGRYVSGTVIIWSALVMLHATCYNFAGFMVVRFFLGAAEATVSPAFALIVALFYKKEEHPLRQSAWFLGQVVGGVLDGLIVWSITFMPEVGVATWKFPFLIYGAASLCWGVVMWIFLPDTPSTAKFLAPRERDIAAARINDTHSKPTTEYNLKQVQQVLLDPQLWLLAFYTLAVQICNGGYGTFGLLILSFSLNMSERQSLLLQMPVAAAQAAFIGCVLLITRLRNFRIFSMIGMLVISLIGILLVFLLPDSQPWARYAGFILTIAFIANTPTVFSLITSNVAGLSSQSTGLAVIFICNCVGNIVGPHLFLEGESPIVKIEGPHYTTGFTAMIVCFVVAALLLGGLRGWYMWKNKTSGAMKDEEGEGEAEMYVM